MRVFFPVFLLIALFAVAFADETSVVTVPAVIEQSEKSEESKATVDVDATAETTVEATAETTAEATAEPTAEATTETAESEEVVVPEAQSAPASVGFFKSFVNFFLELFGYPTKKAEESSVVPENKDNEKQSETNDEKQSDEKQSETADVEPSNADKKNEEQKSDETAEEDKAEPSTTGWVTPVLVSVSVVGGILLCGLVARAIYMKNSESDSEQLLDGEARV